MVKLCLRPMHQQEKQHPSRIDPVRVGQHPTIGLRATVVSLGRSRAMRVVEPGCDPAIDRDVCMQLYDIHPRWRGRDRPDDISQLDRLISMTSEPDSAFYLSIVSDGLSTMSHEPAIDRGF